MVADRSGSTWIDDVGDGQAAAFVDAVRDG
jgi:hypothetical protein